MTTVDLYTAPSTPAGGAWHIPPGTFEAMRGFHPWVRFLSILAVLASGFHLFAGVMILRASSAPVRRQLTVGRDQSLIEPYVELLRLSPPRGRPIQAHRHLAHRPPKLRRRPGPPLTAGTGAFWFFDAANLELVVKILDASCSQGSLTNRWPRTPAAAVAVVKWRTASG